MPLGGNYRLIDIPVSNCLNSNINKIYCLTQVPLLSLCSVRRELVTLTAVFWCL